MQVVKDIALRMLNAYVSPYVENLNPNDLQLSVLAGKAEFHDLRLKKSVLERFGLPVEIVAGDIGKLSITIPWQAIKNQPARIEIDDIYVLARARTQGKIDPDEDARIEQATKQERLRRAEAVDNATSEVQEGHGDDQKETYLGAITTKIINNVQIHIRNIHMRYEDGSSTPEHPFAAGLTISEFKMVSTDENWVETFLQNNVKDVHKLAKLSALSLYFDTDSGSLDKGADNQKATIQALKTMLSNRVEHQYILKPVTGEARLVIHRTMTNEQPKFDINVLFDEIGVVLDGAQYRDALSIVDIFHFYHRTHQYYKFRPPEEDFKTNPAKARWKYALNAIRAEVHDRNRRWSWDYFAERRDQRKKYVDLYVRRLALPEGQTLPPEEETELDDLEKKLSYEDIRFFRSVARVAARKDAATRRRLEAEQKKHQPVAQTWSQWLWGSSAPSQDEDNTAKITEDEQKEIDDIIDYSAWSAEESSHSGARDIMHMRVTATLNKGSFSLRTDPHGSNLDVTALVFDSFSADFVQLTDSMKARMALGGFRVYDGTTPNSLYPQIVRVKELEGDRRSSIAKQSSVQQAGGTAQALAEIGAKLDPSADPFFVLEFENKPLDGRADNAVSVKMRHLEIIYHRNYVEAVMAFLKPPASQLESINALLDAAGETLDGIRKETRAGLEYALEQHKTLDMHVDMNAPIIVIPMDVTQKNSQVLVLDAGHIAVDSKLADQEQLNEVQAKRGRQYSDDDYKQLEELMYDRVLLKLDSTQLLMGDDIEACLNALNRPHTAGDGPDLHIVERINMSFTVQNAIVNAPTLTKFKISGELPELQVNFSDRKYQSLMKFIDVAIPHFGDDDDVDEERAAEAKIIAAPLSPAFQRRELIEYNLDDRHETKSVSSHQDHQSHDGSSIDGGHRDQFYDTNDDTTENQRRELQQINFEFVFAVGKLQASLFRSTSATSEKPLAAASLEGFGLTFLQRKYEMSVDLFLKNVTLAMLDNGEVQRPLLSSGEVTTGDPNDVKLVRVKYLKVQKDAPDFMTKHEGIDTSIDTELSTFDITLAPEPILSLYDFIMTTFVSHDDPQTPAEAQAAQQSQEAVSTDKMRIRVKLTSAQVSLENNDLRFALLSLPSADVGLLLRGGTMRVAARLGNLSLLDTTDAKVADPAFKKLLTIEGGELADFSYETYNPDDETFPGYNSLIHLRSGSLKFTFMEDTLHSLMVWLFKFGRMKAVYDQASQAAMQSASEVTRMRYDVVVKTPIIVLPSDGQTCKDCLILRLGEIFAKNNYLNDKMDTSTIEASLTGVSVLSEIHADGKAVNMQLVEDVGITANIKQIAPGEHRTDPHQADTEITTEMSDVKLSLTERQYVLVMNVLEAIPRALSSLDDEEEDDSGTSTPFSESAPPTPIPEETSTPSETHSDDNTTSLVPELAITTKSADVWTSLDLVFSVKSIGMELFGREALSEEDLKKNSIARFALIGSNLAFKSLSNGAMEAEFTLRTLAFESTRVGNSVYRDIVPQLANDGNQIMVQYTKAQDGSALAMVTIDSPRFILAVEPLAALLEFAVAPFKNTEAPPPEEEPTPDGQTLLVEEKPAQGGLSFRIDIVNSTVIVLADDTDKQTQAIQLSIKEILVSQNNVLALKVDKLGMSFGRMDQPDDRLSFLDDVSMTLTLDTSRRGAHQMTIFDIDVPVPVIFRASVNNIMLILDIVNKASAAAAKALASDHAMLEADQTKDIAPANSSIVAATSTTQTSLAPPRTSTRRASVSHRRTSSAGVVKTRILVSKEHLTLRVNGFQFVLVGDLQEMPMVHLSTSEFTCMVNDWSGELKMATSLTTSMRYFNLSNSYFEPLLDPWKFDIEVARTPTINGASPLSVKLSADQRMELSITSAFIELGITSMTVYSKQQEKQKDRGPVAPFRVRNRTGMPITIWPESDDLSSIPWHKRKTIEDGADIPWFFQDRQALRDNVSAFQHNSFGLELPDGDVKWDPVRGISVDREGEHILNLRPRIDKVTFQLMCDIELENNIKVITIRSTLTVDNESSLPVEMIVVDAHGKAAGSVLKIDPGTSYPVPFDAVYDKRFRLRPLRGFGFDYGWSSPLHWRQLITRPIRAISCKHMTPEEPAFYFQAQANFNAKDPSARIYPRISLVLRAPVELENLLPYDLKFRIHDKATSMSSSNFLVKGGTSPIHTVELSHLLLLSVAPEDTAFKQSDYAIINTDDPELPIEDHFSLSDQAGLKTMLKLHYYTYPNSGGAFKVQVYSPFILLNKTGLPFDLMVKGTLGGQKPVAGRKEFATDYKRDEPTPFMFSFPNDDRRNRLFLRVADSRLSQPLSFEPSAADMQIVLPSEKGDKNYYVGLSYTEGLGKYKLTKVITIAPRFLIKNLFKHAIQVRQTSEPRPLAIVQPSEQKAIRFLGARDAMQLRIAFDTQDGAQLDWSAPFSINDIGRTNIRLTRQGRNGPKTYLARIMTHMEGSSLFLYMQREMDPWPIKLRNDTELPFMFKQAQHPEDNTDASVFVERKLMPHETVDYTWDWPTSREKRLLLATGGIVLPRPIDVMAIGVQPPMKIPSRGQGQPSATITIDISADGSSQLLVIAPYNEERNVYKVSRKSSRDTGPSRSDSQESLGTMGFEAEAASDKANFLVLVELEGVGLSVVTKRPDELLYLTLRGIRFEYKDYPAWYEASFDCKWIQIDNQLFGGIFPIILYPTVVPKDGKELDSHPTLQTNLAILKDNTHGVSFVKYASILLQAMTIELDEDFVMALMDFTKFKDATWREPTKDVLIEYPKGIPEPNMTEQQNDLFFQSLQLQPISLELSFMRTDRVNVDEKVSTRNPFYYALNALTMTLGNVNAAPVNFRALFLDNVRLSGHDLQERVILHYQEQAVAQIYRVLGSADFLGNPVGLFNNISSGFADFFYEPWQGFVMHGNRDIGVGIARGATSLAMKTVFGITDSMTKFTSSIGKGLSAATLDQEYQTKRRMAQRRNKPKHALYGVAAGASAFADSVTSAFEGVAAMPMEGAEKGGAAGFARGVGKGFVGLFTKPVVGVMDFISASTEGIRNTTTVFDTNAIDRVRLPRFIANDAVLRPYSAREALGQSWLKDLDAGAYFSESYVAHLDIPGDDAVAILSNNRLLYVQLRRMRVIWQVSFDELQSLSLEASGIALVLRGGTPGPFLPIAEQTGREWFFRKIAKVVEAYNKSHSAREDVG
ncbi:putative late endosome to vacuole transport-related protein [Cutaneotrichosporon oleaginosum]|uniref:Putative late endosome to vacuole transport-related protein n=1 Tax=Cutaneotrichosporon oleaginosum TaxID=879819 RepID=A0A0J1B497_9TREE|nr:putative late endosome to vacuole transport-related protein [Cutaneotrichosporon oleaginosum]KLT42474.1 putative late endosome to vacuole transport-related protein [Cutaneotrichosporon oleaginosum]TXT06993.1 hypothetical protein COLE_06324 [Cutaneotrichosporon oleaginosum]